MGMPHITSFCCCLGLEQGSRLVGYLHLLISLGLMGTASWFAANLKPFVGTVEDEPDHTYATWYKIAVAVAVLTLLHVALALTLLYGVYKRNTIALRVWVWAVLALAGAALLYVAVSAARGLNYTGSDIFLQFLYGVIFFGCLAYCILCVHSFYLMLRSCEDMEGPCRSEY
ncbi:uncharacterized protein LOC121734689 [Aricia agestis]|uniref:uncharacterized protein LOC121734689 n=1 Tax=Aricia agestis TaxID=91739 RepID=UPI001C206B53|nr:uncharacterized protein LOC121734689 [Aricia agestis]